MTPPPQRDTDRPALRVFAEMHIAIVLAAVLSWLVAGTVTPGDCSGQNAQPGVLVWVALAALGLSGPAFGIYRAQQLRARGWTTATVIVVGTAVSMLLFLAILVIRVALIDCS